MDVLEKVENLCKENEISFAKLEKDLGYSNGSLKKATTIKIDRLVELANYFNVSVDYLLGFEKEVTEESIQKDLSTCDVQQLKRLIAYATYLLAIKGE